MREQLLHLIEVQKIDAKIAGIQKGTEQLVKRLSALDEKLATARQEIDTLQEQVEQLKKDDSERRAALQTKKDEVQHWEKRGSDIRNTREYTSLQHEIESNKRAIELEQEQLNELKNSINAKSEELVARQAEFDEQNFDTHQESTDLQEKIAAAKKEISELEAVRDSQLQDINSTLLTRYTRIRDRRKGIALVAAKDGSCTGCHMNIPPQLFNTLLRVNDIITCPSCGRILYWAGLVEEQDKN